MYWKLIAIIFLTLAPALVKAQEIEWREDRPLTWKDFNGKPDYGRSSVAVTVWSIHFDYHCEVQDSIYKVTFTLQNIFKTQSSWVKRAYVSNEYILGHEQLHFDICELFTRKLAAAFHSAVFTSNYKAEIQAIYNKYWGACRNMEAKYDTETASSTNEPLQYQWQLYISLALKALPRNY